MTQPDHHLPPTDKGDAFPVDPAAPAVAAKPRDGDDISDLFKAMCVAAVIALTIRSLLFEPFNIPSGSMYPSLLVGDYLFVEKYAYGYSKYSFPLDMAPIEGRVWEKQPQRGDIAVFRQPQRVHVDYIKRIIGLPGDTVQVRNGSLFINGTAVQREYLGVEDLAEGNAINVYQKYRETLPGDEGEGLVHHVYELSDDEYYDNTEVFRVPDGFYFAMGDNRDSSLDSRAQDQVGMVPAENLVGRAAFIFFSTGGVADKCDIQDGTLVALRRIGCYLIEWPQSIRYNRLFRAVHDL